MTRPWSAEVEVSVELARALIELQFGDLAPANVRLLGVGWDNSAFVVNDSHVFRFPRRRIAVELLERENRLLPWIAPQLPLPIPVPCFLGQPDERFPWPFSGYPLLPGRTACAAALDEAQRARTAEPLARFLAALHSIPADEATQRGAGADTFGRLDLSLRRQRVRDRLGDICGFGLLADTAPWEELIEVTPPPPDDAPRCLVHGDFYVRHLLVNADGMPSGVIDWGDVHLGHPALDLSIAHTFLPPSAHEAFRRAYGPIDDVTWQLARFRALDVASIIVVFGHETGQSDLVREGLRTLRANAFLKLGKM